MKKEEDNCWRRWVQKPASLWRLSGSGWQSHWWNKRYASAQVFVWFFLVSLLYEACFCHGLSAVIILSLTFLSWIYSSYVSFSSISSSPWPPAWSQVDMGSGRSEEVFQIWNVVQAVARHRSVLIFRLILPSSLILLRCDLTWICCSLDSHLCSILSLGSFSISLPLRLCRGSVRVLLDVIVSVFMFLILPSPYIALAISLAISLSCVLSSPPFELPSNPRSCFGLFRLSSVTLLLLCVSASPSSTSVSLALPFWGSIPFFSHFSAASSHCLFCVCSFDI